MMDYGLLGLGLGVVCTIMTGVFYVSRRLKKTAFVDVFWSLGIMVLGYVYILSDSQTLKPHQVLVLALVSIWALRLSGFMLWTRILHMHIDTRYEHLEKSWGKKQAINTYLNYLFQGLLQTIISIGFLPLIMHGRGNDYSILFGASLLSLTAIILQSTADWQRHRYSLANPKGVCSRGLWGLSRHPNYFFEVLFWVGIGIITFSISGSYLSWIPMLTLWVITRYITAPFSEKLSLSKRGKSYANYMKETPMIIPSIRIWAKGEKNDNS